MLSLKRASFRAATRNTIEDNNCMCTTVSPLQTAGERFSGLFVRVFFRRLRSHFLEIREERERVQNIT